MVKSFIISATKANQLFWLGRYQERVYMTLHLLRKCYDRMIDGSPDDYAHFWHKLDTSGSYTSNDEFTLGMLYDQENPCSVFSAINRAMDNGILLREDICSETLSYIEMSIALMKECSEAGEQNITQLQPITDWSLAFWGSAEQRIMNPRALLIMNIGRGIEYVDMLLRYDYPYKRVSIAYRKLRKLLSDLPAMVDENIASQLDSLIFKDAFDLTNEEYKQKLIKYINQMVRV